MPNLLGKKFHLGSLKPAIRFQAAALISEKPP